MDTARRPIALTTPRPIWRIAQEISTLWRPTDETTAVRPFLDAMRLMEHIHDNVDDLAGRTIVTGFLKNSHDWTGPDASRIKAELRSKL